MVSAPRQRNSREDNAKIKQGQVPEGWEDNPNMLRQKDLDARWTKKHGRTHYDYKNHISIDRKHKLIRHFEATSASVADNTVFDALLDPTNTGAHVWTDAACRPVLAGSHSRMPATAATSTPRARRTDRSRRLSSAPIASAQNTVVAWSMSLPRSMRWLPCWGKVRNCL